MRLFFKRLKRFLIAVTFIISAIYLWPYSPNLIEIGLLRDKQIAKNNSDFVIGVSWPLAQMGPEFVNGMRLAIQHLKTDQHTIKLIQRDDQNDLETTLDIAREFARNSEISAVIGYTNIQQASAAKAILTPARVLQIIAGTHTKNRPEFNHPYVIQMLPDETAYARYLAQTSSFQNKRFAIITEKDGFRDNISDEFAIAMIKNGGTEAQRYSFAAERLADFTQVSYELRSKEIEAVLFAGEEKDAASFINQLTRIGLNVPIFCACMNVKLLKKHLNAHIQPIFIPAFYDVQNSHIENQAFLKAYEQKYQTLPNQWAAQGYDAIMILAKAAAETESHTPDDLSLAIRYMNSFQGVTGRFEFSEDGNLINRPAILHKIPATQTRAALN